MSGPSLNLDDAEEVPDGVLSPNALQRQAAMVVYLESNDVPALDNPEEVLSTLHRKLKSDHWVDQFQALDSFRSLSLHHTSILSSSLTKLVPSLSKCIESLRSSVCKNGLLAAYDVCTSFQTSLEPSVPTLLTSLLKRCADHSNIFISASANSALVNLIETCPGPKLVQTLSSQASSKNAALRTIVAKSLSYAVDTHGAPLLETSSDATNVIKLSAEFLSDKKPGTRAAG